MSHNIGNIYSDDAEEIREKKLNRRRNGRKFLNTIAFIGIIAFVITIISFVIKIVNNPLESFEIREGVISKDEATVAYVVRDEQIINNKLKEKEQERIKKEKEEKLKEEQEQQEGKEENTENKENTKEAEDKEENKEETTSNSLEIEDLKILVDESRKAAKNQNVCSYYLADKNNNYQDKKIEVDKKIEEVLQAKNSLYTSSETKMLDLQMENEILDIGKENMMVSINEKKKDIFKNMNKKSLIVANMAKDDAEIKSLLNEKETYEKKIIDSSVYLKAPFSGIVSYRIDGYEDKLKGKEIEKYNKKYLENLHIKSAKIVQTSNDDVKVIYPFKAYIICNLKSKEAKNSKVGDKLQIMIPSGIKIKAKIANKIKENDGTYTIAFEINEHVADLNLYRKTNMEVIWWYGSGYKILNTAIRKENDYDYIVRRRGNYFDKVYVKVKNTGDKYSIIEGYTKAELNEKKLKSGKILELYDEIIQNPTEKQIEELKNE